jgi:hypothetical protein
MLESAIARVVAFCTRYSTAVVLVAFVLGLCSAVYAARHFAIDTDTSALLSPNLPWRKAETDYNKAFPQEANSILAVVQAPTPELARGAASELSNRLSKQSAHFRSVSNLTGSDFFVRNSLLYLPAEELEKTTGKLSAAAPLLRILAGDPSLRGLGRTLQASLQGVQSGRISLDDLARPMNMAADSLEHLLAAQPAAFSWRVLVSGTPAKPDDLRQLVSVWPTLDYDKLEPGMAATQAVRDTAADAKLDSTYLANVRLTGSVPIADDEFATLRDGSVINGIVSGSIVLIILWLALRSVRLVAAVAATVLIGLAITAALGLRLVGALNPISVAFAVLFVGLGADFAIQFSVRYRTERHAGKSQSDALIEAGKSVGPPLTLAAAAAAAGFFSFLPTAYSGLAELGLIAGCGMVVAYVTSMTLLPALLNGMRLPPEPNPLGYAALAPVDCFLQRHRIAVVACTSIIVLAGLPALLHLQFDFNPNSLRNPNSEAVATLNSLRGDPRIQTNTAEVLVPTADIAAVSKRLSALPEVAGIRSIDSFIPNDQGHKLSLLGAAASTLNPALNTHPMPAPTDAENVAAIKQTVTSLRGAAGKGNGPGAKAAGRLADDLTTLADGSAAQRDTAQAMFVRPLKMGLNDLHEALNPQRVTRQNLPEDLVRSWTTTDGRARLEIAPKGDANDSEILSGFARAVLAVAPDASGQAIATYEWGRTVLIAFAQAGGWALCAIALLLIIVLRRVTDMLLTLIPLLVAAAVTLEICALTHFPLNYANIIALPVLLGIGVAFKIYYVMAWRRGETNFLQSSLTRAVFFSALMTATAFGSLWLSSFPGTSSMGKLLALSLACTLASAALFQPALMGQPRHPKRENQNFSTVSPSLSAGSPPETPIPRSDIARRLRIDS